MANFRQIHCSIWKDPWFIDLTPTEKLIFIYFITNDMSTLSGIYEISISVIVFETGIRRAYIEDALKRFAKDRKVYYEDGIIWVKNLRRYHATRSDTVRIRILNEISSIPDGDLKTAYLEYYGDDLDVGIIGEGGQGIDRVLIGYAEGEEEDVEDVGEKVWHPYEEILDEWGSLFPSKPQPRKDNKSLRKKAATRWSSKHFQETWRIALARASKSVTLQVESWFTLEYFLRNDDNYQKCLDDFMAWKDQQKVGGARGQKDNRPIPDGV